MESDKATFELTAEKAGILHTKAQEGETIPVGTLVCINEESEAPAEEASSGKDSGQSSNEAGAGKDDAAPAGGAVAAAKAEPAGNAFAGNSDSARAASEQANTIHQQPAAQHPTQKRI